MTVGKSFIVILCINGDTCLTTTVLRTQVLLEASWRLQHSDVRTRTQATMPPLCSFVNSSDLLFNKNGLHT